VRILITGGGGQLATDLEAAAEACEHDVLSLSRTELDITDRAAVAKAVAAISPSNVINCAAWTAVDACESDPKRADLVNGEAVGYLADACRMNEAHLVQVSTDYVFDGNKVAAYVEDDVVNPQSSYGRSKLLGEQRAGQGAAIVRTSWVYSAHGGNMVETICRLAAQHDTLRFVSDQIGHPTHTADLARALLNIAEDRQAGVWHCTNAGAVSWHEFAQAVLESIGQDPSRVQPVTTAELQPPRPAPRPANSVLGNERYNTLYSPLPDFREQLATIAGAYRSS